MVRPAPVKYDQHADKAISPARLLIDLPILLIFGLFSNIVARERVFFAGRVDIYTGWTFKPALIRQSPDLDAVYCQHNEIGGFPYGFLLHRLGILVSNRFAVWFILLSGPKVI